jgi:hypothetical protein
MSAYCGLRGLKESAASRPKLPKKVQDDCSGGQVFVSFFIPLAFGDIKMRQLNNDKERLSNVPTQQQKS